MENNINNNAEELNRSAQPVAEPTPEAPTKKQLASDVEQTAQSIMGV